MKKIRHSVLPITLESSDELKGDFLNSVDTQMTNNGWSKWTDEYGNWFDPFYKDPKQLVLFDKPDEQIILEVEQYFDYLEKPNDAFSGMPVCPFLKPERLADRLMVKVWRSDEQSLSSLFDEFFESKFKSALFICVDTEGIKWKDVKRKSYQNTLQDFLKHTDYKPLCFSPYEKWSAGGEETRKKSPYFLVNVALTKELDKAHKGLIKTNYFKKFNDEEIKKLKVYPKKKK